jgi:hypothetical protein
MKRSGNLSQVDPLFTANLRVIAGFLFAPILGFFLYYALSFIIVFPGFSFSHALSVGVAAVLVGGKVLYIPALLIAVAVMLIIRRFYQWNLISSIIGSMIIGLLVVLSFAAGLWMVTSEFTLAQFGFFRLLSIIIGPSVLAGVVFWFLAVHRNVDLHHHVET